jgi:hypothetical protein
VEEIMVKKKLVIEVDNGMLKGGVGDYRYQ